MTLSKYHFNYYIIKQTSFKVIHMKLRFRQLQAFHAIIQTGTVVGAAEMLGISQPGVSNLISQLERQTGLKLFEESPKLVIKRLGGSSLLLSSS